MVRQPDPRVTPSPLHHVHNHVRAVRGLRVRQPHRHPVIAQRLVRRRKEPRIDQPPFRLLQLVHVHQIPRNQADVAPDDPVLRHAIPAHHHPPNVRRRPLLHAEEQLHRRPVRIVPVLRRHLRLHIAPPSVQYPQRIEVLLQLLLRIRRPLPNAHQPAQLLLADHRVPVEGHPLHPVQRSQVRPDHRVQPLPRIVEDQFIPHGRIQIPPPPDQLPDRQHVRAQQIRVEAPPSEERALLDRDHRFAHVVRRNFPQPLEPDVLHRHPRPRLDPIDDLQPLLRRARLLPHVRVQEALLAVVQPQRLQVRLQQRRPRRRTLLALQPFEQAILLLAVLPLETNPRDPRAHLHVIDDPKPPLDGLRPNPDVPVVPQPVQRHNVRLHRLRRVQIPLPRADRVADAPDIRLRRRFDLDLLDLAPRRPRRRPQHRAGPQRRRQGRNQPRLPQPPRALEGAGHHPSRGPSTLLSKRMYSFRNVSFTTPVGPLRCFATITSAERSSSDPSSPLL